MDVFELANKMDEIADELADHGYECLGEEIRHAADSLRGKA